MAKQHAMDYFKEKSESAIQVFKLEHMHMVSLFVALRSENEALKSKFNLS
jgi:hypothetical protein